jgi:PilZ domain
MSNVLAALEQLCKTQEERRKQYRLKICRPVHIRMLDPAEKLIQEDTATLDITGHGLCFATTRDHYHLGMSLFLRFGSSPFRSPSFGGKECVGDVVRVHKFSTRWWTVAVRFRPKSQFRE